MAQLTGIPSGDGAVAWSVNTGSRWDAVNDPIGSADDDTTYIFTTASGQRNSFTFAALAVPAGATVNWVEVRGRVKYIGTSSDFRLNIRNESATISEDTDRPATSSYTEIARQMTTNPFTGSAWTVNQVNTDSGTANRLAEIEIRSIAPNTEIRCTQLYFVVDYTVAAGRTTKNTRPWPLGMEIGMQTGVGGV